ncbi:MAG: short-chain dehydrogenase [Nocardia sp.]|uniref:SDR family NAD(P)-dependent oxidoreductase n=1 Tax=Nocardia sp. TaxID=1821 RepID=UPI00261B111E|nr:glucose 1-dehydrogenase [Nocardia sp.]MCU1644974.1 short-chain dehydrogenase [Nocardia sp.]
MTSLNGKVALVTGASKGIGAAIAIELAAAGARVGVNYSASPQAAEAVVARIEDAGGSAFVICGDISEETDVERMFADLRNHTDHLDILVNNAGVYQMGDIEEVTWKEFTRQFSLNVFGLTLVIREALASFLTEGSTIINIGSSVSSFHPAGSTIYTASKGAVDAITRTLANELGPRGIRVNSVNPGLTETEGMRRSAFSDDSFRQEITKITPLRRIGMPGDIAPAVAFLASDAASWVTGETLVIGGGLR